MCGKSPVIVIPHDTNALLSVQVIVLDELPPISLNVMRVVSAFVDLRNAGLAVEIMSDLTDVDVGGIGTTAEEVVELCTQQPTDVILVCGKFFPYVEAVRTELAQRGLPSPLWISFIGPPKVYSHEQARSLNIYVEMHVDDFTDDGWRTAVQTARQYSQHNDNPVRVMTATTTDIPNKTLSTLLEPWGFTFAPNRTNRDDLLSGIFAEKPHLVLFGHAMIADVGEVRLALRNSNFTEPHWAIMLAHLDPLTLINAAIIGVENMFSLHQLEPAEDLAALMRSFAEGQRHNDSALSRVGATLAVAKDDDDRAILRLLATGATNDAIAGHIFASEQSVKNRLSRMMKAAGVSNRTEVALLLTGTKLPPPRHSGLMDEIPVDSLPPLPSN